MLFIVSFVNTVSIKIKNNYTYNNLLVFKLIKYRIILGNHFMTEL